VHKMAQISSPQRLSLKRQCIFYLFFNLCTCATKITACLAFRILNLSIIVGLVKNPVNNQGEIISLDSLFIFHHHVSLSPSFPTLMSVTLKLWIK
jgi:hypothetical protein